MLPADLRAAEQDLLDALQTALAAEPQGRWTAELRFQGLRLLPVVLRLAGALAGNGHQLRLLFPDAGAAALARRDGPALALGIASFADQRRQQGESPAEGLLLLVTPSQAEYEVVEALCGEHRGAVVLFNPALEDAAVGIGSVARQRRRGFLAGWQTAYALIPEADSALRRAWPDPWELYRLDPEGFRRAGTFERKPDAEQRSLTLSGATEPGIAANLRALDQLIEGLQH